MDDDFLRLLVRLPFLSLATAAWFLGAPYIAMDRTVARLRAAGVVERVPIGGDKTLLYCLTDDGVITVAHAHGLDPDTLAATYGLGHRAFLARLPALARALDVQDTLLPLIDALLRTTKVTLVDYRLGPLRWGDGPGHTLTLDGQVTMDTTTGRRTVGLLWDEGNAAPASVLHDQLRQLVDLRERVDVPPVLLVTSARDRVPWPHPPGVLWTTATEARAHDPLETQYVLPTLWGPGMHERPPRAKPLVAAVEAVLGPFPVQAQVPLVSTPCHVRPGRHLDLERRLVALRRGTIERRPTPPGLLALALPPRALEALGAIGRHPLLRAPQLAEVCDHPPARLRDTLALLAAHGLAEPNVCGDERVGRYVLTRRGLRLLAARASLPAAAYREAYGVLEDAEDGVRHGLDFAAANLTHTTALQDVFLAFLRAARGRDATLWWWWEWACARVFDDGGERRLLRPDADVVYDEGGRRLRVFVEVDRSTCPLGDITDQIARYHGYARATGQAGPGWGEGSPAVTVAYITTKSEARARNIIAMANAVAAAKGRDATSIRVLATSLKCLMRRGPLERIWWRAGATGLTTLFQERSGRGAEWGRKSPPGSLRSEK